ncbi:hypothetical protein NKT77_10020 [Moraxella sp. FZLJ2107]|uniref:hypothetical protein n=1 Tax=unclassified Moraxella TaxID=2685852 RepID=UPI0020C8C71D|nr:MULTISPECIES: hypothetical protein [unclassified Moraxella]UTO04812.1 hypothetical protein NKT77_09960 [Moraxella sp. FZLJ2107]UTO04824.1 hypothetical protein NKT77_10020 [Moraxella sp. FZLJ2107]UTO21545.1 hypothetical protein NKU06_06770 [Moraxella sp. FZLJ2109]UTO21557.1 hypothetical protein NKU06_06830 [Moraxella sp. FZLJ2109]
MAQSSAPSQHQRQYRQQSPNGSRLGNSSTTATNCQRMAWVQWFGLVWVQWFGLVWVQWFGLVWVQWFGLVWVQWFGNTAHRIAWATAQQSAPSQHQRQYRQQSPNGSRHGDGLITITAYHWAMASMPTISTANGSSDATAWRGMGAMGWRGLRLGMGAWFGVA